MNITAWTLLLLASSLTTPPSAISPQRIDELVAPLIQNDELVGVVILVIDGDRQWVRGYGHVSADPRSAVPSADTIFEIGSVTKTFTTLVLQQLAGADRLDLNDPVANHLPDNIGPLRNGKHDIRLVDLATHCSGLPRLPSNFDPASADDPYADYDEAHLFDYLKQRNKRGLWDGITALIQPNPAMRDTPFGRYSYSNLGMGLLGHVLARVNESTYETLIREHIADPLQMADTWCVLDESRRNRLAPGHLDGDQVSNWKLDALAGAGAIRSTASDLAKYIRLQCSREPSPLATAARKTHEPRESVDESTDIALGWHIRKDNGWITHGGQTGGYSTSVECHPPSNKGVIVLSNQASAQVHRLGLAISQLLEGQQPKPIPTRAALPVKAEKLREYVGKYQLAPTAHIHVTLRDGTLRAQLTGQAAFRIYAQSPDRFFYRIVDATIVFERNEDGDIDRLRLLQNGRDLPAKRIPEKNAAAADVSTD